MNKKILVGVAAAAVIGILFFYWQTNFSSDTGRTDSAKANAKSQDGSEMSFLPEGYPADTVPLYKSDAVSSGKVFVNIDPRNISSFDDAEFAYYNVVFDTEASPEEFLSYYRELYDTVIEDEFSGTDTVMGTIGEYRVTASHYGSGNTAYLQVHLPAAGDPRVQPYFTDFPSVIPDQELLTEHEKSYGLLNQNGGEIEYTQYFTVADSGDRDQDGTDDEDEFAILEDLLVQMFRNEAEYAFDETARSMTFTRNGYDVTVSITPDHGRIYVMQRKGM